MWGPGWLGPLQRAPALPGALQVRPEGRIPPGAIWGNSPPRVFSSPAGVTAVPVPQGEVPGDGLPGPQSRDEVVRPHPPAERYRRHCRPPASPLHPPGWGAGTWHGIGPTPSPQNPEGRSGPRSPPAALSLPFPSHHLRAPRVPPPCPSSLLLPAGSPSTIDPTPVRRGSDAVVIASILASLGTVLAAAVLGAVGYGGCAGTRSGWGDAFTGRPGRTPPPRPRQQRDGATEMF